MNRSPVAQTRSRYVGRHIRIRVAALLVCFSAAALAQSAAPSMKPSAPFTIRVTHVLGLEDTKNNCNGTLSIEGDALHFQHSGKVSAQVKLVSVRNVFVGGDDKQVGGVPLILGKAAAPYGTGRVLSLFTHKKYDTLTLEYVDRDGAFHAAIFQLNKGQGELVKHELVARRVPSKLGEDQPTKETAEVTHESK